MIKKTILGMSLLFLFSCADLKDITTTLNTIDSNQKLLLNKLDSLEKNMKTMASNKPNPNKKNERPKADPNKVYNVADAGSIILGKKNAPVTIIKWTDYQ